MTRSVAAQIAQQASKPVAVPARPVATPAKPVAVPAGEPATAKPVATPVNPQPVKPVATPVAPQPAKPVATPAFPTPPQPHIARPVPGYKQTGPLPLASPKAPSLGSIPENLQHHTSTPEPTNLRMPDRPSAVRPTPPRTPEYPSVATLPSPTGGGSPSVPRDNGQRELLQAIERLVEAQQPYNANAPAPTPGRGEPAQRRVAPGVSVWTAPGEGYAGGASPSMDVSSIAGAGGASSRQGYGSRPGQGRYQQPESDEGVPR